MASLLERIQNVFDNHQDLDRDRVRQEGHQQALYQTRDALLGSAVLLKDDWSHELVRSRSESHVGVHAKYEARIKGLNDAFSVLRQSEPGITTQLNPDEFRESATRHAQVSSHHTPELGNSQYHLAYAATRNQLDAEFARRETTDARLHLIQQVGAAADRHLITPYPSDDREAGIRQATVDWANQHDEGRLTARGAERPILNHEQYRVGYDAMKETLDRKLDTYHGFAIDSQVMPSRDTERQAVQEMALQASQGVRENWGDRGRGPERLNDPDYDRGQRKAIMDWSHEQNHRLTLEQQRIMSQERTREVHEYGISY
jgi:hypothetical protein